jgi:hypothetical protein
MVEKNLEVVATEIPILSLSSTRYPPAINTFPGQAMVSSLEDALFDFKSLRIP